MNPKPRDATDSTGLRGYMSTKCAFNEFSVEADDGSFKFFSGKQSKEIVAFVHSCALPVRIRHAEYRPGNGMRFVHTSNKRRSEWVPDTPKTQTWFFEGVPPNRLDRMRKATDLLERGLHPTIAAGLYGYTWHSMKKWKTVRNSGNSKRRAVCCA